MEREIICKIDFGALDQHIYLLENDKTKDLGIANFSNLSNALVAFCKQTNCNLVHLYGSNDYLEKIIRDISKINYDNNEIIVEVN